MTQEELIQFLKDNLRIKVTIDKDYYSETTEVTVGLCLGDEYINSDSYHFNGI